MPESLEQPPSPQLSEIAEEIRMLRTVLDEIRTDLEWAVQNGRLVIHVQAAMSSADQTPDEAADETGQLDLQAPTNGSRHAGTLF